MPDEHRASWRPQDTNRRDDDEYGRYRDRDDPRRWEGSRGSEVGSYEDRDTAWRPTERYGQGQSGYSAGRHGDDRGQRFQSRNDMIPGYGHEDRHHDPGVDDRFGGRGRSSYWLDRGPDERMGQGPGTRRQQLQDERHAHAHRGTGPHRGKGPVGYQRSDERIREAVCESLSDDDQIDASQIEVSVKDGEVTLTGTVDDRRAKREAEDCAYAVSGVRDVLNQLRVKGDDRARGNASASPAVGSSEAETRSEKKHRA